MLRLDVGPSGSEGSEEEKEKEKEKEEKEKEKEKEKEGDQTSVRQLASVGDSVRRRSGTGACSRRILLCEAEPHVSSCPI